MSHVASHIFILFLLSGQSGGANRWIVCYQRGLPRLVSFMADILEHIKKIIVSDSILYKLLVIDNLSFLFLVYSNSFHFDLIRDFKCFNAATLTFFLMWSCNLFKL